MNRDLFFIGAFLMIFCSERGISNWAARRRRRRRLRHRQRHAIAAQSHDPTTWTTWPASSMHRALCVWTVTIIKYLRLCTLSNAARMWVAVVQLQFVHLLAKAKINYKSFEQFQIEMQQTNMQSQIWTSSVLVRTLWYPVSCTTHKRYGVCPT